ncbi:uncharacterized protein CPUR_00277 [Claviceps purpurea 20.1]|uniref:Uncharacterized protein n=1 Tax=Claviceps purpurea (strain 20.1) TaxID=1111077 RepID=M1W4N7_CLAP2|nr:uncharacterized protein CPUR_00277 [Claviceps purpurea 20.1]
MEAAAKKLDVLSQRILPPNPHYLSFSASWRHPSQPEDEAAADPRTATRRFEEWNQPRLQYPTFLSDTERGLLLTRSYHDMREEPTKPLPRDVTALLRGATGTGEKKKLSLSDYRNKKTVVAAQASTPNLAAAKQKESERAMPPTNASTGAPMGAATGTTAMPPTHGARPYQDPRRSDGPSRPRDSNVSSASARLKTIPEARTESRLPPKPASLPPRPPSPLGKRRMPDHDDERLQKRPRPDDRRPWDDRMQRDRDEASRRKDRGPPPPRDRDHRNYRDVPVHKDDRGNPSSSHPSGRPPLKGPANPGPRRPSPARPPRRPSLTGNNANSSRDTVVKSEATTTKSGAATTKSEAATAKSGAAITKSEAVTTKSEAATTKSEAVTTKSEAATAKSGAAITKSGAATTKSFVPPLLSPLHLSFESREKEKRIRAEEDDAKVKKEKERKRRDDSQHGSAPSKPKKLESTAPAAAKKPRPTVSIPPLLSPTLPPVIEAELKRRKKTTAEASEEPSRPGRDAVSTKKRPAATRDVEDDVKAVPTAGKKLGHCRRLLVVLQVPKHLRAAFAKIVGPKPEPKAESKSESKRTSHGQADRDLDRKPRAGSDEAAGSSMTRKRPNGAAEGADAPAAKRPRSSDQGTATARPKHGSPSTPSKKTTAMSRVSSSNSLTRTPTAAITTSTPSASAPAPASASTDRRPNGTDKAPLKGENPEAKILRDKEEKFMAIGKHLKHEADPILQEHRSDTLLGLRNTPRELKVKRGYVLSLESIIAFMLGFHARNTRLAMYNQAGDMHGWHTMFPLMECLLQEMQRMELPNQQPLHAMLLLFFGILLEELIKCPYQCEGLPPPGPSEMAVMAQQERRKVKTWGQVRQMYAGVRDARMRVDVKPWSTVDDVAEGALRVLKLWCREEGIEWVESRAVRENWPVVRAATGQGQNSRR